MKIVYFYAKDGKKIGPLSKVQLDDLHLEPETLVWHYGLSGWIPYKNLPEQAVKKEEASPFDEFRTWLKNKKEKSIPMEEHSARVETSQEETPTENEKTMESVEPEAEYKEENHSDDAKEITQDIAQKEMRETYVDIDWKKFSKFMYITFAAIGILAVALYIKTGYIPEKRLNNACAELEEQWNNSTDSDKLDMAEKILDKRTKWGFENVDDSEIHAKFGAPKRNAALKIIEDEAFGGNVECQYLLGLIYARHDLYFVNQDNVKAAYWWNEAAQKGHVMSTSYLGVAYQNGWGVKQNYPKAIECYKIAANANDDYALNNLACLYETGVTIESGYHYEQYKTFEAKPVHADDILVSSGWDGKKYYRIFKHKTTDYKTILPKDIKKACELWKKAASLGNENAKEKLQRIYE